MTSPAVAAALFLTAAAHGSTASRPFVKSAVVGNLVHYRGAATLEGTFAYAPHSMTGDRVCFLVAQHDAQLVPRALWRRIDAPSFCFTDTARAKRLLSLPEQMPTGACRLAGSARVRVSELVDLKASERERYEDVVELEADLVGVESTSAAPQPDAEPARRIDQGAEVVFDAAFSSFGVDWDLLRMDESPEMLAASDPLRSSAVLVDPSSGVFIGSGRTVVELSLTGERRGSVDVPLTDLSPSARGIKALVHADGRPVVLVALGAPRAAWAFRLDDRMSLIHKVDFTARAEDMWAVTVLGDATIVAQVNQRSAGRNATERWILVPSSGAPRTVEVPRPLRKGSVSRLGPDALYTAHNGGFVRVDKEARVHPISGCEACRGKILIGGSGAYFGCVGQAGAATAGQAGWSLSVRTLHVCQLQRDGSALSIGKRQLEPSSVHDDGCHFRGHLPDPSTFTADGMFFELEDTGAPAPRVRLIRYDTPVHRDAAGHR